MTELYKAKRELKIQENGRLVTVKPGQLVRTESWDERVIRAHINQNLLERTFASEAKPATRTRRKPKSSKVEEQTA